ncbi:hypothetical protein APHMUC_0251 [Anaplasma phagocytophilum str. ApMUC09]|uniref:Uncharacterized protein n=1 Tax=Anaplasma phagocytophilum str. ApMUC09 TaxID=1359152 RepID=A0A0F3NCJ9_ANAPH|nr:hypothetical protein APHMUC_0251 [Anaplasma phagocytophilum str. ApMUC09]
MARNKLFLIENNYCAKAKSQVLTYEISANYIEVSGITSHKSAILIKKKFII